jgi:uncharacterized membrane protein YcaP (DUF421 family)
LGPLWMTVLAVPILTPEATFPNAEWKEKRMTSGFHDVIGGGHQVLWWQMSIRAVLIFLFGLGLIRLFGRRVFSRQNPLDIVIAIIIGSNLSRALTGTARFVPTLAATAVIVVMFWLFDHLAARWPVFSRLTKGQPLQLIRNGELNQRRMSGLAVTEDDIEEAARASGLTGLDEVEQAVFERNGKISTIARKSGSRH